MSSEPALQLSMAQESDATAQASACRATVAGNCSATVPLRVRRHGPLGSLQVADEQEQASLAFIEQSEKL